MQKLLKIVAISLMVMGLLGQVWTLAAWTQYAKELPRSPDPETGRVYRLDLHGVLVYQTAKEHFIFWHVENWSWGIAYVGLALSVIYHWRSGGLKKFSGR